jgi:3-dehydroquinate synthase
MMKTIVLKTPSMQGKIYIGREAVETRLPTLTAGQKNFVVTDDNVYALYKNWFKRYFPDAELFVLPAGEENKNFSCLQAILEKMTGAGMRRTSRLFAVGGGVVGDIGGLAAALYMRGISYVQIPTTLLAQVDSSVGGKTAVDLGGIKNIVGAFYQPCEVLIDPAFLSTLPEREVKCGLGEIVKYAALSGGIFDLMKSNRGRWTELAFLENLIAACVEYKARVVERDEKETGERRSLNVGHTTGHAIELSTGLSHGEGVLYGMLLETKMAISAGVCEKDYGAELLSLIEDAIAQNPIQEVDFSTISSMAEKARSDKKNTEDGKITMAVAKAKGVWDTLALPFEEYKQNLQ